MTEAGQKAPPLLPAWAAGNIVLCACLSEFVLRKTANFKGTLRALVEEPDIGSLAAKAHFVLQSRPYAAP